MTSTIEKQMCLFQGKTKIMIRMFMKIIFSVSFCQLEHLLWSSSISWQLLDWNYQNNDNPPDHHRSGFWSAPSGKLITAAEKPRRGKHLGTLQNAIIIIILKNPSDFDLTHRKHVKLVIQFVLVLYLYLVHCFCISLWYVSCFIFSQFVFPVYLYLYCVCISISMGRWLGASWMLIYWCDLLMQKVICE